MKIPVTEGQPRTNIVEAAIKILKNDSKVVRHPGLQAALRQHECLKQHEAEKTSRRASNTSLMAPIALFSSAKMSAVLIDQTQIINNPSIAEQDEAAICAQLGGSGDSLALLIRPSHVQRSSPMARMRARQRW